MSGGQLAAIAFVGVFLVGLYVGWTAALLTR
jgi:hypothetical protein